MKLWQWDGKMASYRHLAASSTSDDYQVPHSLRQQLPLLLSKDLPHHL